MAGAHEGTAEWPVPGACFFSQSCACNSIVHVCRGALATPLKRSHVQRSRESSKWGKDVYLIL